MVAAVSVANVVVTLAKLHPLEYVAMNTFAGGTRGAYGRFELDYLAVAATEALRRLESRLEYERAGRKRGRKTTEHLDLHPVARMGGGSDADSALDDRNRCRQGGFYYRDRALALCGRPAGFI